MDNGVKKMPNDKLKFYKKKKNIIIGVISFSFSLLIAALIYVFVKKLQRNDFVVSLLFVLVIAYFGMFVYFRSKLVFYTMNYHYFKMLDDNLGLLDVTKKLYTKTWLDNFKNDGYLNGYEDSDFVLYYQFFKKIPNLGKTGHGLIAIVVAKKEEFELHQDKVNIELEKLFMDYEDERKVKKQIILQFKKYQEYDINYLTELNEIINFKNSDQILVSLNIGYFVNQNQVYLLRPKSSYYNKYHYYATQLAMRYSNVLEEANNE